ncbi:MAG: glucose-6-phosphate dehydrogenase assembly protein OpcA [Bryobacteraceae bacterium]
MATSVQPEKILKDLGGLWVDLGKQGENGVLRACAMTFIVTVDESQDAFSVGETIAAIMHDHPSRAIVVRVGPSKLPSLDARVLAQCWMPFGRNQQICCEQIEISSSLGSLRDVPGLIRGLIVPDLPVVLYCRNIQLSQSPQFQDLLPLAGKLVIDSGPSGLEPLGYLASLPWDGCHKADLTWCRLTQWRESIAQIFESPANLQAASSINDIQISYSGEVAAYYLAAWFKHILGVEAKLVPSTGPSFASIARVELRGPGFEAVLEMVSESSEETRVGGIRQRVVFPEVRECDLLREELSVMNRDPIFESVLHLANSRRGKA